MQDKEDFLRRLEWQLAVEEEGVRFAQESSSRELSIDEAKSNRDRTATLVNLLGGPLSKVVGKTNCLFVKKGGG